MDKQIVIRMSTDGDQWCALIGSNLQEGIYGFGDTPKDAVEVLLEQMDDALSEVMDG